MVYSFARIGAALGMTVEDVYTQNRRLWVRLREEGWQAARDAMSPSSACASAGSSTGVCPLVTTCRGPHPEPAGLTGTTWPVTSQSNRWRIAASRCLTLGAASSRPGLDPGCDMHRLDGGDRRHADNRRTTPRIPPRRERLRGACADCGCWPRKNSRKPIEARSQSTSVTLRMKRRRCRRRSG
jgi:hypothetical protein